MLSFGDLTGRMRPAAGGFWNDRELDELDGRSDSRSVPSLLPVRFVPSALPRRTSGRLDFFPRAIIRRKEIADRARGWVESVGDHHVGEADAFQ